MLRFGVIAVSSRAPLRCYFEDGLRMVFVDGNGNRIVDNIVVFIPKRKLFLACNNIIAVSTSPGLENNHFRYFYIVRLSSHLNEYHSFYDA